MKVLQESRIFLADNRREISLRGDPQTLIRLIAAVRHDTDTVEKLLQEASYFDETISLDLLQEAEDIVHREAPFRLDLSKRLAVYDSSLITFSYRGVLPFKSVNGLVPTDLRTYALPRTWTLYDAFQQRPVDEKASIRRERDLWSEAVGAIGADGASKRKDGQLTIDGLNLAGLDVQDLVVWTKTADDGPPLLDGKSVYELRLLNARRPPVNP